MLYLIDEKSNCGIAVGIVYGKQKRVLSFGRTGTHYPLGGDVIFEIASLTKLFTATLLAQMSIEGLIGLDDPISSLLPATIRLPDHRRRRKITLRDLATHRSGLSCLPPSLRPSSKPFTNPYADYGVGDMYRFLSRHSLKYRPGSRYEYSNLGYGLLGHLLAVKPWVNFEQSVIEKVCEPLRMTDTLIEIPASKQCRFARGRNAQGRLVQNWDFQALAGCGALRSTVNDLIKFLSASMELTNPSISAALELTQTIREPSRKMNHLVCLGWHVLKSGGQEVFYHAGQTGGFVSCIGFSKECQIGVVALCNRGNLGEALDAVSKSFLKFAIG